jgi:hypothetical protein
MLIKIRKKNMIELPVRSFLSAILLRIIVVASNFRQNNSFNIHAGSEIVFINVMIVLGPVLTSVFSNVCASR